jgi:hypothetical protein
MNIASHLTKLPKADDDKSTIVNHLAFGLFYQHLPYQVSFYKLTAHSSSRTPPCYELKEAQLFGSIRLWSYGYSAVSDIPPCDPNLGSSSIIIAITEHKHPQTSIHVQQHKK